MGALYQVFTNHKISFPNNYIIYLHPIKNAIYSQALIQLKNVYCKNKWHKLPKVTENKKYKINEKS